MYVHQNNVCVTYFHGVIFFFMNQRYYFIWLYFRQYKFANKCIGIGTGQWERYLIKINVKYIYFACYGEVYSGNGNHSKGANPKRGDSTENKSIFANVV